MAAVVLWETAFTLRSRRKSNSRNDARHDPGRTQSSRRLAPAEGDAGDYRQSLRLFAFHLWSVLSGRLLEARLTGGCAIASNTMADSSEPRYVPLRLLAREFFVNGLEGFPD